MDILTKLYEEYHRVLANTGKPPELFRLSPDEYNALYNELSHRYDGLPYGDETGRLLFKMIPVERVP